MRRLLGDLPAWMSSSRYWVVRPWAVRGCTAAWELLSACDWRRGLAAAVTTGAGAGAGGGSTAGSWVASGVGSWAGVENSAGALEDTDGALEDSGSGCEVWGTAVDAGVSGADDAGVEAGAAGTAAAPGLLRAALGANFLPVVFSNQGLAHFGAFARGTTTATHC